MVILLAVNVAVSGEAGNFSVERASTLAALQTGGMPTPLHSEQVIPVDYLASAASAHDVLLVFGRRAALARLLLRLILYGEDGGVASVLLPAAGKHRGGVAPVAARLVQFCPVRHTVPTAVHRRSRYAGNVLVTLRRMLEVTDSFALEATAAAECATGSVGHGPTGLVASRR